MTMQNIHVQVPFAILLDLNSSRFLSLIKMY